MQAKIIAKKQLYSGFFKINQYEVEHDLFEGENTSTVIRECFERGHASAILAFDPILDNVILIEQFRIGVKVNQENGWVYEVIAGIIEHNQTPEDVAIRESQEEAGCHILALEPICQYYTSPGGSTETLFLYCGAVDSRNVEGFYGLAEEGEDIRALVIDYKIAINWLNVGKLNNASTIISMQWLILNHARLVKKWKKIY